jgi:endoglucanase
MLAFFLAMSKSFSKLHILAFLICYFCIFSSCSQQLPSKGKIPINVKYWYQLNNLGDQVTPGTGLQQLNDGVLDKEVFMGWGKLLANYDSYYEFKDLADVTISKVRLYDGEGSFATQPFKLYAKSSAEAAPVLLASFTGDSYKQWVEITLPKPMQVRYLVLNTWWGFPTEMELYGTFKKARPATLRPKKDIKLANEIGINSFVWEFLQNDKDPNIRDRIYEPNMALMQTFTQYRDYVDWGKIESTEGQYTFNPTVSGGWNYDLMYKRLKEEGKEVLPCLKTLPNWFLEKNYPADQRDAENIPAAYKADLLSPASYLLQAKLAFQFAARYGSNKGVNPSLLQGVLTGPVYATAPEAGIRTREVGLGYIRYVECENERDKWWKGRKAYQTAREYAANLSAFYDGHKNTMGPGVGVKNADPHMQVVLGGTASAQTDYLRGIIDWCKEYRGYKADGTVNLCFDVMNYHCYANSSGLSQSTSSARGAAPEVAAVGTYADAFVDLAREYNKEVWITEAGYDINGGSPLRAPAIGNKSPEQVQADWILRTALLYARHGINRLFLYQTYDLKPSSGEQFASSGLLDGVNHKRKPAADYLYQVQKLMGNYRYKETISTNPLVDRYELNGKSIYALMMPTEQNKSVVYSLNISKSSAWKICAPKIDSNSMDMQAVDNSAGALKLTVTETPVFVVPASLVGSVRQ